MSARGRVMYSGYGLEQARVERSRRLDVGGESGVRWRSEVLDSLCHRRTPLQLRRLLCAPEARPVRGGKGRISMFGRVVLDVGFADSPECSLSFPTT